MKNTVTILSLFDGMACGYIAFKELNIPNADFSQYKNIDWLIGGSPCTYWSIAQKSSTRETEASGIGWERREKWK